MKLVLREQDSNEAEKAVRSFLKRRFSLCTADIALAESLNALWKHTNIHKDLDPREAKAAVEDLIKIHDKLEVVRTGELAEETMTIARSENITVYDALYMAAARKLNAILLTSDKKLYDTAEGLTRVRLLKGKG